MKGRGAPAVPPCFLNALSRSRAVASRLSTSVTGGPADPTRVRAAAQRWCSAGSPRKVRTDDLPSLHDDAGVLALVIAFQGQYRWTPKGCQPAGGYLMGPPRRGLGCGIRNY